MGGIHPNSLPSLSPLDRVSDSGSYSQRATCSRPRASNENLSTHRYDRYFLVESLPPAAPSPSTLWPLRLSFVVTASPSGTRETPLRVRLRRARRVYAAIPTRSHTIGTSQR